MIENKQLSITRIFNAPRELVYKAWAEPEHLARWYAPEGCAINILKYDFRPGGMLQTLLKTPENGDCLCGGVFQQVIQPEIISFTSYFVDVNGNRISASDAGKVDEWPAETLITVTFSESNGKTILTLRQSVSETLAKQTGAYYGWESMFERLEGIFAQMASQQKF